MKKLVLLSLLLCSIAGFAQKKKVVVLDIKDEIDPRMERYVELGIGYAKKEKADIVIIEMDTYGGVLTDAKEIVDLLMKVEQPLWVFINADAASAGALISIACDSIYMSKGATIGAATVVSGTGEKAPDKYQSYMRSIMRSTAEENGRDPQIAEAMVDENIEIDSVTEKGKVITFSTSEAIKFGFCEAKVSSIEEILERNKVEDYSIEHYELSGADKIIAVFLNPFISGILILVIVGGLYFELQSPGVGFPGLAALVALVLYLVPYYLNGLAENWEIITLFAGLILIAAEIFVIPGFGVAGISGIVLVVSSMVLIMLNNDFFDFEFVPSSDILAALVTAIVGVIGGIFLLFAFGQRITQSKRMAWITLPETQQRSEGYTSNFRQESMIGKIGRTYTVLRPSGKIVIDDQIYDAYTRGDYIEKDVEVIVENEEGVSLRVKSTVSK